MSEAKYFVVALNAEPWAIGSLGISMRGKKPFPYMSPNQKLQAYQEALKAELGKPGVMTGEVEVKLFIWRRLETMKMYGSKDRKAKTSDATNIQKATEDAIQGVLIENDRNVRRICTEIVAQDETTEPCIVISVKPYETEGLGLPDTIWHEIDKATKAPVIPDEGMLWSPHDKVEDVF